jgi:hypothetical protein
MSDLWTNILFTTDKGLFKLFDGKIETLHVGQLRDQPAPAYGLTWDDENILMTEYAALKKLDKKFSLVAENTLQRIDYHQCLYVNDEFYVCTTKGNAVSRIDTETLKVLEEYSFEHSNLHLNSIFYKDDHFYVCLHGRCKTEQCVLKKDYHSQVVKLTKDFQVVERWLKTGCGAHNVYVEDDYVYTLNSVYGKIVKINALTDERDEIDLKSILNREVFPRGLARNNDYFYVGVAEAAQRERRGTISSSILTFTSDMAFVGEFKIPGFHHLREIRLVNQRDYAHSEHIWKM